MENGKWKNEKKKLNEKNISDMNRTQLPESKNIKFVINLERANVDIFGQMFGKEVSVTAMFHVTTLSKISCTAVAVAVTKF